MDNIALPDWVPQFLNALQTTGLFNTAAVAAGTTMRAVKALRNTSIEFDGAVEHAEQIANDVLESEARRRAVDGIEKGVYYQGIRTDTETVYSDGLLTTLLKAKRPDEFAERKQISGAGGAPLTVLVRQFGDPAKPHAPIDAEYTRITAALPVSPEMAEVLDLV